MKELILMHDKNAVTTSLIVSEVFGKEHKHVLESVKKLTDENSAVKEMFVGGTYENDRGREYPMYYMNRDGFTLLVMSYTGKEALQFKLQFIDEFNRMEEYIQSQQVPETNLELALRAALKHETDIKEIRSEVGMLKDTMRIDGGQEYAIRTSANKAVINALGGKDAPAYKQLNKKVFAEFWREFKAYFTIPRYGDLQRVKFDEAMKYISIWKPKMNTQLDIEEVNGQQTIWSEEE